jgi:hypothetical protein
MTFELVLQHTRVVETDPLRNRPHLSIHNNSFPLQGMLGLSNHDDATKGSRHEKSVTLDRPFQKLHYDHDEINVRTLQNYEYESRDVFLVNTTTDLITTTTSNSDTELLARTMGKALNSIGMKYRHRGSKKKKKSEPQRNVQFNPDVSMAIVKTPRQQRLDALNEARNHAIASANGSPSRPSSPLLLDSDDAKEINEYYHNNHGNLTNNDDQIEKGNQIEEGKGNEQHETLSSARTSPTNNNSDDDTVTDVEVGRNTASSKKEEQKLGRGQRNRNKRIDYQLLNQKLFSTPATQNAASALQESNTPKSDNTKPSKDDDSHQKGSSNEKSDSQQKQSTSNGNGASALMGSKLPSSLAQNLVCASFHPNPAHNKCQMTNPYNARKGHPCTGTCGGHLCGNLCSYNNAEGMNDMMCWFCHNNTTTADTENEASSAKGSTTTSVSKTGGDAKDVASPEKGSTTTSVTNKGSGSTSNTVASPDQGSEPNSLMNPATAKGGASPKQGSSINSPQKHSATVGTVGAPSTATNMVTLTSATASFRDGC